MGLLMSGLFLHAITITVSAIQLGLSRPPPRHPPRNRTRIHKMNERTNIGGNQSNANPFRGSLILL